MKILFISVCSYPYVTDYGYQDNGFCNAASQMGDEVVELTTSYIPSFLSAFIVPDRDFTKTVSIDKYGVKIIRVKYKLPFFGSKINSRLRIYKGIYSVLEKEKPNIIFVHDLQTWSLFDIAKYLRRHPKCVGLCDIHSTYENTAHNFISKYLLGRIVYRFIVKRNISAFRHVFYISHDIKRFMRNEYHVVLNDKNSSFLPLGDLTEDESRHDICRKKVLGELGLPDDAIILIHSGKLVKQKRTSELIEAFKTVDNPNMYLLIVGKIPDENKSCEQLIESDKRIKYLGWKTASELKEYIIASDLYVQPGTASSTLNTAICCGCPVMLSPIRDASYRYYLDKKKVFFADSVDSMKRVLKKISDNPCVLNKYREYSRWYADTLLDYRKQIEMIKSYKNG